MKTLDASLIVILLRNKMASHIKLRAEFQQGFTMTELITVIVIVGILSAAVIPKFFDRNTFDSRGFYDQTLATLRYAQKTAISQHRLVCVTFPTSGRVVLYTTANFADVDCVTNRRDLLNPSGSYPAGQTTYTIDAPAGVTLSGAVAFNFDALGRPTGLRNMSVSSYAIVVEAETGYVH